MPHLQIDYDMCSAVVETDENAVEVEHDVGLAHILGHTPRQECAKALERSSIQYRRQSVVFENFRPLNADDCFGADHVDSEDAAIESPWVPVQVAFDFVKPRESSQASLLSRSIELLGSRPMIQMHNFLSVHR